MNNLMQHLTDVCELEWNTALLTMPLTSGAGVSRFSFEPLEDIEHSL